MSIEKIKPGQMPTAADWNELADQNNRPNLRGSQGGSLTGVYGAENAKKFIPPMLFKMMGFAERDDGVWRAKCLPVPFLDGQYEPLDTFFQHFAGGQVWVYFPTTYRNVVNGAALEYAPRSDRNKYSSASQDVTAPGDYLWAEFNRFSARWEYVGPPEEIVRFQLIEDQQGDPPAGRARILRSNNGTAEPVAQDEVITVVSWSASPSQSGTKGYCKRKHDLGRWESLAMTSDGEGLVIFELINELTLGGTASAVLKRWDGQAIVTTPEQEIVQVRDFYGSRGQFSGTGGYRGLAMKAETEDAITYLIVWMEHRAIVVRFQLTIASAGGNPWAGGATVNVLDYYQGKNPGATVTVHDPNNHFAQSQTGAKGFALWNDASKRYEVIQVDQMAELLKATASADFASDQDCPLGGAIANLTFFPYSQTPTRVIQVLKNDLHLSGKQGDVVYGVFDATADTWCLLNVRPRSTSTTEETPFIWRTAAGSIGFWPNDTNVTIDPDTIFLPVTSGDANFFITPTPAPTSAWNRYRLQASGGDEVLIAENWAWQGGQPAHEQWIVIQCQEHAPCILSGTFSGVPDEPQRELRPTDFQARVTIFETVSNHPPRSAQYPVEAFPTVTATNVFKFSARPGDACYVIWNNHRRTWDLLQVVQSLAVEVAVLDEGGLECTSVTDADVEWTVAGLISAPGVFRFVNYRGEPIAPYTGIQVLTDGQYRIGYGCQGYPSSSTSPVDPSDPINTFADVCAGYETASCNLTMHIDNTDQPTNGIVVNTEALNSLGYSFCGRIFPDNTHNVRAFPLRAGRIIRLKVTSTDGGNHDFRIDHAYIDVQRMGPPRETAL